MKNRKKRILALFNLILFTFVGYAAAEGVANKLIAGIKQNQVWPLASELIFDLDLSQAYAIQRSLVESKLPGDRICGFKAALTTKPAQERFGLQDAASGVLLDSMRRTGRTDIVLTQFHRPMMELEVAFVVDKKIVHPLEDIAALKSHIRSALPAIEIPDLRFAEMEKVSGVDIIAANTVASAFISGNESPGVGHDFSQLKVTLYRDSEIIKEGSGSEFTGDPWRVTLKLVNQMLEQGWEIKPGSILLSGAMGGLIPAQAGFYEARFEGLGSIQFTIR